VVNADSLRDTTTMARRPRPSVEPIEDESMHLPGAIRASVWIVAAGLAATGAVMVAQTEVGARRIAETRAQIPALTRSVLDVIGGASRGPRTAEAAPTGTNAQTQDLTATVQSLAADRDRLLARLDAIERSVDATGTAHTSPDAVKAPFGIDVAGGKTLEGLRTAWATMKGQQGGRFDSLQPLVVLREGAKPGDVEFRLVAGPVPSATAAARWCAALAETLTTCRPAPYEGQRLTAR
jgi:hypothetical protein